MPKKLDTAQAELAAAKHQFAPARTAKTENLLMSLKTLEIHDTGSLLHFHDNLLFLRAFPSSRKVVKLTDKLLQAIEPQVGRMAASGADMSSFDKEEFSGVAGTELRNSWTFELARSLVQRHPGKLTADWNLDDQARHMAIILPNLLPVLGDDSFVEPDTPFLEMMSLAAGGEKDVLRWLLNSFDRLPISPLQKTDLYDSLDVQLVWKLDKSSASRTLARRPVREIYIHDSPLLQRRDVSLQAELKSPALPLRKLSRDEGQEVLDFARDALAVRYRELHGSTNGEPRHMYEAAVGRGVTMYLWGVSPEWRLPLRGYYAGLTLKNGVPINYFEAIGLFEWLELGFNTFYAFREGETAWIYSKIIHLLHQVCDATCISVYPYQLGHENEEAITSGAFWFYRKLGFRPGRSDLLAITEKEEARMGRTPAHRTSPATLRKLAAGHVFFEFGDGPGGRWDSFSVRNVERAALRHMAERFDGDEVKFRRAETQALERALDVSSGTWPLLQQQAFTNFACVLSLVPELKRWSADEKHLLFETIRAKAAPNETNYFRLLQRQPRLRDALLRLGSA